MSYCKSEKEKKEFNPSVIFTHHGGDLNIDHQKTFEAVMTACRPMETEIVKTIITFETPSGTEWRASSDPKHFLPNLFFQILQENGLPLDESQIDRETPIEEINKFIGNKIPKRMQSISDRMAQNDIKIRLLGIDKKMLVNVSVANKHNYSKKIQLSTLEKWTIDNINAFNEMRKPTG
mgnify:CR=1 FL=1